MKFTCLSENLAKALSIVNKAVSSKSSLPVLSNVLISSENGRLKLSATNLETAITTWIGASIEEEGAVTVPSKLLYEFVSNLPASTIEGNSDDSVLKIKNTTTSSKFNGISASEFPTLPESFEDSFLNVDPKIFAEAVHEVAFATSPDESRPVFTGVLIASNGEELVLVGVDGFRLAERSLKLFQRIKEFSTIVPAKILMEVARITSSLKETLEISLNTEGNLIIFKSGDVLISSRLIEGDFPDYKARIPDISDANCVIKFKVKDLMSALRLSNVFAKDSLNVIKIKVNSDAGGLEISSSNTEIGENHSNIEAEIEGEDIEVAFNSRYFLDILGNVKADEFNMYLPSNIGPGVPGVLKPAGREDYTHLIMPLQF